MEKLKSYITEKHTVKYSNLDENGRLKPMEIARWFQDIFLKQDEVLDIDRHNPLTWVLLNYDLNIYKYPKSGDNIQIETFPYSFNRFYGNRMFYLKNENEEILAQAKTRWLFVEKEELKIKRITDDVVKVYCLDKIEKGKGFEVDKINDDLFKDAIKHKLMIRYDDLDINHHVNNSLYFSYFYDYTDNEILKKYIPYKIQITYKKEIKLNNEPFVYVKNTIEDDQIYSYYKICDKDNNIFTLIKVLWKDINNEH